MADANPHADLVASGYDRVADAYAALDDGSWPRLRWLRKVLERVPPGGAVLDLGCGNGVPATQAIAREHAATGIDISREQIERARAGVPGATFLCGDALSADLAEGSFDAVVSFYMLDHLPREQHADLFARIAGWLRPGGFLLVTAEVDDEPGMVGEWLGEPMFFSAHDASVTQALIAAAGFEMLEAQQETQNEGGREVAYVWLLARREMR